MHRQAENEILLKIYKKLAASKAYRNFGSLEYSQVQNHVNLSNIIFPHGYNFGIALTFYWLI